MAVLLFQCHAQGELQGAEGSRGREQVEGAGREQHGRLIVPVSCPGYAAGSWEGAGRRWRVLAGSWGR